ncbi:MAG: plasmid segregation centromere-binding protein ParR [Gemmiger sp.]|uniref:plasmid segregation centromere-binding protein ParR n=1 Tax=Gemmiger sp. TaxID=2049027 RepID=UPI00300F5D26
MKRPQYVFRPNLNEPQHRRAWALLQQVPPAKRKEFLVQSILAAEQTDRLEKSIRKVVREELQATSITTSVSSQPPANAIPDSALDFLSTL